MVASVPTPIYFQSDSSLSTDLMTDLCQIYLNRLIFVLIQLSIFMPQLNLYVNICYRYQMLLFAENRMEMEYKSRPNRMFANPKTSFYYL